MNHLLDTSTFYNIDANFVPLLLIKVSHFPRQRLLNFRVSFLHNFHSSVRIIETDCRKTNMTSKTPLKQLFSFSQKQNIKYMRTEFPFQLQICCSFGDVVLLQKWYYQSASQLGLKIPKLPVAVRWKNRVGNAQKILGIFHFMPACQVIFHNNT